MSGHAEPDLTGGGLPGRRQVNHLAHFHLTTRLLPLLERTGRARAAPSQVITVASDAHFAGRCNPRALAGLEPLGRGYNRFAMYCDSKLCNVLFSAELARRGAAAGILSNAVHPGIVDTGLVRYLFPAAMLRERELHPERSARAARLLGLRSSAEGAAGTLWLAERDFFTGKYFSDPGRERALAAPARDPALAASLWAASEVLVARAAGEAAPAGALEFLRDFEPRPAEAAPAGGGPDLVPSLVRMLLTNTA